MKTPIWILLTFLLAFSVYAVEERVQTGFYPDVYLYSQSPDPVQPGNYVELRIKIENIGTESLNDFQIELVPSYPFSFDANEAALKQYGNIGGSVYGDTGVIAKWKLRVDEKAVEGDNKVRVKYRFGKDYWMYEDILVSVKTLDAILNIKGIRTVPEIISPGEQFNLILEVENQADSFLKNIRFKIDELAPFVPIGSTDEQSIRVLGAGESENVTFILVSQGSANQVVYTIPLKVSYYDNEEDVYTKNISFGVILAGKPQLIKNIDDTAVYSSGDKGKVTITISNIGVEEVKFVKASLMDSEDYRVISSREVYLGNIDSDDFESAVYDLYVKTKKESVPLEMMLDYKDALNRQYSENFSLYLPMYSSGEARKLGLKQTGSFLTTYLSFVVFVFAAIFWIYMIFDLIPRKMVRYKKISWFVIILLTTIFGAALYYFLIKRKNNS